MSTRSTIAIVNADKSITGIYCHFDGYPSHHVPILTEHYATEEKVRELIALGGLSSLAESIGEKHDFDHRPDGVCNAHGRDRGEEGTDAYTWPERAAFEDAATHDYAYLFENCRWMARSRRGAWAPATKMLAAEES